MVLMAAVTSLPELAIGSNLFNMAILAVDDMFYVKSPLLAVVENQHLIAVMSAVAMTGLAVAGLIYRSPVKRYRLSWDTFGIFCIFVANLVLLYILR